MLAIVTHTKHLWWPRKNTLQSHHHTTHKTCLSSRLPVGLGLFPHILLLVETDGHSWNEGVLKPYIGATLCAQTRCTHRHTVILRWWILYHTFVSMLLHYIKQSFFKETLCGVFPESGSTTAMASWVLAPHTVVRRTDSHHTNIWERRKVKTARRSSFYQQCGHSLKCVDKYTIYHLCSKLKKTGPVNNKSLLRIWN